MTEPSQDHTIQKLLAFYDRVNPVLSEWLAKPAWTAEETALLCAGLLPPRNRRPETARQDQQESDDGTVPIDLEEFLPPNRELYAGNVTLLAGKEPGRPRDMVNVLRQAMPRATQRVDQGGKEARVNFQRPLTPRSLTDLQWLLVIGNAVGLQVPAVVPFSLLNGLRDRLIGHSDPSIPIRLAEVQPSRVEPGKPRGRQPVPTAPAERGYFTTEEVAGLTNLRSDTLNKYAREGVLVEGYTPFKRQNGRAWRWRDAAQQALFHPSSGDQEAPRSAPAKSLASFLGSKPFAKS